MDDDIRSRLRGGNRSHTPSPYQRPISRPVRPDPPKPIEPKVTKPSRSSTSEPIIRIKPAKPKRKRKSAAKKVFMIGLVLLFLAGGAAGYWFYRRHKQANAINTGNSASQSPQISDAIKPTGTIRFIATGDNFTFDSINNAAKKADGSYDYLPMLTGIKSFYDKADIKLCNESVPTGGTLVGLSGYPNFNAPPQFAKGLGDLGCNVINMGTAHMNDKGQAAINSTVSYWDNQPGLLAAAGANRSTDEQNKIHYFSVKQVKFAFLSYTTINNNAQVSPFSINVYTDALAQQQITEARKNAQFVIVSMNWGTEDSPNTDSNQDHIAQSLADANADVVIGVGSHVIEPVKILDSQDKKHQTLVWFSLGNLLNSQVPVENLIGGIAVMDIDIATQNIKDPKFLPVYMHYEWTAEQKKRQSQPDLLARHNFILLPLDQAATELAKSQNNTNVQAQTDRVTSIITKFAPIKIIKSSDF